MSNNIIAAALAAILCAAPACAAEEDFLKKGADQLKWGQPDKAVPFLREQLKLNPADQEASTLLGVALSRSSAPDLQEARRLLNSSVDRSPARADVRVALCRVYRLIGPAEIEKSLYHCKMALTLEPTNADALYEVGMAYREKGDLKAAIRMWTAGAKINPDSWRLFYQLGSGYLEDGEVQHSITALRRAELIAHRDSSRPSDADMARVMFTLAEALSRAGRYSSARDAYAEAEENEPLGDLAMLSRRKRLSLPSSERDNTLSQLVAIDARREKTAREVKVPPLPQARTLDSAQQAELGRCISSGQELFASGKNAESEAQFRKCLDIQPADENSRISLAGVLMVQNKLDESRREFELVSRMLAANSPLRAYSFSRLGDIAMKQGATPDAAGFYRQAIAVDPNDVNAQVGLGRCLEISGDMPGAHAAYGKGLSLEPGNPVAHDGLRRTETFVMTDPEILTELKERKAVASAKKELAPQDKELFNQMRSAEEMGAVDYLKRKLNRLPPTYICEKTVSAGDLRLMLTWTGYVIYRRQLTKDSLAFFERKGLPLKTIMQLKDMKGQPLFEKGGLLSYDGMQVYYYALIGEKRYLLPSDPLPPEAVALLSAEDQRIVALRKEGYMEINAMEYGWLLRYTDCSEETFTGELSGKIITMPNKEQRYFIDSLGNKGDNGAFGHAIMKYRNGETSTAAPRSGNFFGSGGIEGKKLCTKQGKVWKGD